MTADSSVADQHRAYLNRKLDLQERMLALKERELALRERMFAHSVEIDERENDRAEAAYADLSELRERMSEALAGESDDMLDGPISQQAGRA